MLRTVVETAVFQKQAEAVWSQSERNAFIDWIAEYPDAGDVIPGSGGARKVRWRYADRGKSGGARVVYFHFVDDEVVLLIMVYVKAARDAVSVKEIRHAWRKL